MLNEEKDEILEKSYFNDLKHINKRKTWGSKYIEKLSQDLKEYGKGNSEQNLYRMRLFSKEFSREEIFSQPAREIPWYTLIEIIHKSKSHEEMIYYINY